MLRTSNHLQRLRQLALCRTMKLDLSAFSQFLIFSSFARIHFDKPQVRTAVYLATYVFSHITYVPVEF